MQTGKGAYTGIYECICRGRAQAYDEHRAMRASVGGVEVGLKGGHGCAQGHITGRRGERANGRQRELCEITAFATRQSICRCIK